MATENKDMQQRRDTAANWTSNNPTLKAGEVGFETDTGRIKLGDGATAWTSLNYLEQNLSLANLGTRAIDNLSDVDTATAPPQAGDAMVFDGTRWVPNSGISFRHTIPLANAGTDALATSMTAFSNAWGVFVPGDYEVRSGHTLQWRVVGFFTGTTDGDVIGIDLYDVDAAAAAIPETTAAADSTGRVQVASAWQSAKASLWRGYPRIRNQTAARGSGRSAWVEVRTAPS